MIDHAKTRSREVRLFPFAPSRLRVINNLSALLSRDMNDDPVSRSHSRQLPTPQQSPEQSWTPIFIPTIDRQVSLGRICRGTGLTCISKMVAFKCLDTLTA